MLWKFITPRNNGRCSREQRLEAENRQREAKFKNRDGVHSIRLRTAFWSMLIPSWGGKTRASAHQIDTVFRPLGNNKSRAYKVNIGSRREACLCIYYPSLKEK